MTYTVIAAAQWPTVLRRERSLKWAPEFQNEVGPPSLSGMRQYRNITGGGLWRASYLGEQLRSKEQILSWFATELTLKGGATAVDVPLLLCGYQPNPTTGDDVVITAVGDTAAGVVTMTVDLENADALSAGQHFSDFDGTRYGWRLHRIAAVASVMGQPTQRAITFWPPLRFAIADNHALEFDEPRCVMRLIASDSMDLELVLRKRGDPNAEFIEAE